MPPLAVFGDLLKTDHSLKLVTVPSCQNCNNPQSRDDMYFRDAVFVAATRDGDVPAAVAGSVRRSLAHAGRDYKTPILTFMREARAGWKSVGDASVLQRVNAVPVRWDRVKRTVERTCRGLYWHHSGVRVPSEFGVTVVGDKERDAFDFHQLEVFQELAQASLTGTKRIVHRDVFMYSIAFASDDPQMAALILCFYRKVIFLALVGPPEAPSTLQLL